MPATQRIFKINRQEVEKMVALYTVTDQNEELKAMLYFCDLFSIPLDEASIKGQIAEYEVLQTALKQASK